MVVMTMLLALVPVGCLVKQVNPGPKLDVHARWVLLPVQNHGETPQAGERMEAILGTLLRARCGVDLRTYPTPKEDNGLPELDDRRRYDAALAWARQEGFAYGVTGSVEEWRYRNGLDGEPAVGVTVQIVDLGTDRVVWSASGSRSGWGRDTVSGTAQKLLASLLESLNP
jgi:hypothetical protein